MNNYKERLKNSFKKYKIQALSDLKSQAGF